MPRNGDRPHAERVIDSTLLLDLDIFRVSADNATRDEKIALAYHRARAIAGAYAFTTGDIQHLTDKFWQFHQDMIHTLDSAAFSLLAIQYNLCVGTLAPFLEHRADLKAIVEPLLSFEISGQFLLPEVGHGLDAHAVETVATLLPDGTFDLHTPNLDAAKFMPATTPIEGFPRIGIVIARVTVEGEDRGVKPFLVWLNDGHEMSTGIYAKRAGSKTLDHCITSFEHVRLPHTALLGTLDAPTDRRKSFQSTIHRVYIATLSLSTVLISALKSSVFVAGKYSFRRHIWGPTNEPRPIIFFRPQHRPILHTLAQIAVFDPFAEESIQNYMDTKIPYVVRQGVATAFKAVVHRATQESLCYLGERCGAHGLFAYNNIIDNQIEAHGNSIAEGDSLALSIRLASELILGGYRMPPPRYPACLLAIFEAGLFRHARDIIDSLERAQRTGEFNRRILPRCQTLVEAVGHRMAYEAGLDSGVVPELLDLYEAGVVVQHSGWFVENLGLDTETQFNMEMQAMNGVLPRLEQLLDATGAEPYCTAPIVSNEAWAEFVNSLEVHKGNARMDICEYDPELEDTVSIFGFLRGSG
ncbi:acyl-CoA oxidase [Aspergillus bombycis]|uniref:Acyl-CoA oxidase n=1 Tax=Aspergillus bombycis TaxID=109264 RepID=A0A1F7ZRJ8_9EURO|nr:acyl-CoA oxidase [Aspergillus bombycis]OGM41715.1 acyl-CoA oxidase [Aspergillus bombycis]